MRYLLLMMLLLLTIGCKSGPPLQIKPNKDFIRYSEAGPMPELSLCYSFQPSLNNKYAIIMKGQLYDDDEYTIEDKFVNNDVKQLTALLTHKGYDVYILDNDSDPYNELLMILSDLILEVANEDTKVFFAYSGKGDKNGLIPRAIKISSNQIIIRQEDKISTFDLIRMLTHPGKTAILLNACESGVFVDEAKNQELFRGVVIASCAEGTLTTPYDPYDTTAVMSTFLDMYSEDVSNVVELSTLKWESVGGWWTNLQYKIFRDHGRLKISHVPVFYRGVLFDL